jgi:hypothetical protein
MSFFQTRALGLDAELTMQSSRKDLSQLPFSNVNDDKGKKNRLIG